MRRNARPAIMVKIVQKSAVATTTHRAMPKVVFACATKDGQVQIVQNHVQKASTVSAAKSNVQLLFLEIKHAITSLANMFVAPVTLV